MTAADSLTGAGDAAAKLAELRSAALDDENGSTLQAKLKELAGTEDVRAMRVSS